MSTRREGSTVDSLRPESDGDGDTETTGVGESSRGGDGSLEGETTTTTTTEQSTSRATTTYRGETTASGIFWKSVNARPLQSFSWRPGKLSTRRRLETHIDAGRVRSAQDAILKQQTFVTLRVRVSSRELCFTTQAALLPHDPRAARAGLPRQADSESRSRNLKLAQVCLNRPMQEK